ncbi:RHS repeat domain-containing protein [Reinekea sp.]
MTYQYKYDTLGRISKVTYPDGYTSETAYDENGNVKTLIVPTLSS